jgi:hypothetical protein
VAVFISRVDERQQKRPIRLGGSVIVSFFAVMVVSFVIVGLSGCSSEDAVMPQIEKKVEDLSGFNFKLPCPVADFFPDYLFASNSPRDGIPSVDAPTFSSASEATWLADDDRVLGVIFEGQPLAIPIRIMVWHEVVNLTGNNGRAAVTYCPLTFTGITVDLEKQFPGAGQNVGVSGLLYNSNLVLYDRKTESLWTQMSGSSYAGPAAGTCLDLIPTVDATFGFWKNLYPSTKVLVRPGKPTNWNKYELNTYESYWANDEVLYPVREPLDNRLKNKDWVLGVLADTGAKAYPLMDASVVNDTLPGVPFVVFNSKIDKTMVAYKAWVVDEERLTFSFAATEGGVPTYVDDQTGSTWSFNGQCLRGPLAGSVLERMPSYLAFYFSWWSYFPETLIHGIP